MSLSGPSPDIPSDWLRCFLPCAVAKHILRRRAHPILSRVARSVLAQVVCASSAERNWSIYGRVKTKERSQMRATPGRQARVLSRISAAHA
mmetsp:Transcript_36987/g.92027  ORF Transcript_36987/g.92027 Transcript_36987/m.92027 type:complete len:91 (+) Transcript_36987:67-339(+)